MTQTATETTDSGTGADAWTPSIGVLSALEAVLVSSDRAVKPQAVIDALKLLPFEDGSLDAMDEGRLERSVGVLNEQYDETGRAFRIEPARIILLSFDVMRP